MKVTTSSLARTIAKQLNDTSFDLFELQQKIATGKRINKPSDDPVNAVRASDLRRSRSATEQYRQNINYSQSILDMTQNSLDQTLEILSRAQEIAITQGSSSATAQTRSSSAKEIGALFDQILLLANSKLSGRYIFAGHETMSTPFQSNGAYSGDSGDININISANASIKINLSGDEIFTTADGGADIFGTLAALKTALEANDIGGVSDTIDDLVTAYDISNTRLAETGAKISRLDRTFSSLEASLVSTKILLSEVEDIDLASAVIDLSTKQSLLEAAMASAGRILRLNLVNYL